MPSTFLYRAPLPAQNSNPLELTSQSSIWQNATTGIEPFQLVADRNEPIIPSTHTLDNPDLTGFTERFPDLTRSSWQAFGTMDPAHSSRYLLTKTSSLFDPNDWMGGISLAPPPIPFRSLLLPLNPNDLTSSTVADSSSFRHDIKEAQRGYEPYQIPLSALFLAGARMLKNTIAARLEKPASVLRDVRGNLEIAFDIQSKHKTWAPLDETSCIVVTGASRGVGEEYVLRLARESKGTIVMVARNANAMQRIKEQAEREGTAARIVIIAHDLGKPGTGTELARILTRKRLIPTALINNAGMMYDRSQFEIDDDQFMTELSLNYITQQELIRHLSPRMAKLDRRTKIICVSSMGGITGFAGNPTYGASRAAMRYFGRSYPYTAQAHFPSLTTIAFGQLDTEASAALHSPLIPRRSAASAAEVLLKTTKEKYSKPLLTPGFENSLMYYADPFFSGSIQFVMALVLGVQNAINERSQKGYGAVDFGDDEDEKDGI